LTPADGGEGAFLQTFTKIVDAMEEAVKEQDGVVEEGCLDLLTIAGTRIYSNLLLADPGADLAITLQKIEVELSPKMVMQVKEAVDALLKLFVRKVAAPDEDPGETSGEDADDNGSSA
jgi:hypothetical protein